MKKLLKKFLFCLGIAVIPLRASAANEFITVPVILADYYGWAYAEMFEDHADVYAWSTAGVDGLGWSLLAAKKDYTGLFLVNLAGISKTAYPVLTLLGASDSLVRERAWIALGTHTAALITLELLGKPSLSIQSTLGPRRDGVGLVLSKSF